MRKPIGFLPVLVLGVASTILAACPPVTIPITYTERATVSGILGGKAFNNAAILLTMNNDAVNVACHPEKGPSVCIIHGKATLSLDGVPLTLIPNDWIRDQEVFSVNGNGPFVGAGFTNGADLLDVSSPLFANYDLRTSIGPITGKGTVPGFGSVPSPTSGGDLVLNSVGDVTFIARTVP
jgi:hypothetical protein